METDVFRDFEFFRNMGTGSIDDHNEKVVGVRLGDLCKEGTKGFGVHFLGEHPVQSSIEGADGPVNIGELAFVAVIDDGAHGCRGPAAADSHHATEANFVLKEEFYLTALDDFGLKDDCQLFREFFFQSSWTLGLLLGWRVSGATLRHPWRARSL